MVHTKEGHIITDKDRKIFFQNYHGFALVTRNISEATVYNTYKEALLEFNGVAKPFCEQKNLDSIVPITITYAVGVHWR